MKQKNTNENSKATALTHDEIKAILKEFDNNKFEISEQMQIAVVIMAVFGLRPSELLALKVRDISLEEGVIQLSTSFQVPIPECALQLFEQLIELADGSDYLFPNPKSNANPLPISAMSYVIRKLVPSFKLYSLRYSFARYLNSKDIEPRIVSKSLNQKTNRNVLLNFDYLEQRREIHEALFKTLMPSATKTQTLTTRGIL
ncbi:tyrosine-type recombinase/integrase [Pseudoalteromonas piscicida]|uniref:tyrosine-type recombinase/integrase n=1 Tax=Pseudoalteromonas piscicida TaxID=43662 RepID=UPI000E35EC8B|nr:tyrosine-type recombinase/integrase [Pseudoalteromonas piscicida]AXQ98999.1 hypothetical protein D0N37_15590 [Pseudoalteromonas piscicida]